MEIIRSLGVTTLVALLSAHRNLEQSRAAKDTTFNPAAAERIIDQTERSRRNPDYRSRPQATFGIEVFEKDASNREVYRDERNGWKGRKG